MDIAFCTNIVLALVFRVVVTIEHLRWEVRFDQFGKWLSEDPVSFEHQLRTMTLVDPMIQPDVY